MADSTSGASGLKDLGGLVNKDIAFSKVPENIVYDSKNFRITTDDGGTFAVRSTIKGNKEVVTIPNVPCIYTITLDPNEYVNMFQVGTQYVAILTIDGNPVNFTFTYSNYTNFFSELLTFIQTDSNFTTLHITATGNYLAAKITLQVPDCNVIGFLGFNTSASVEVSYPYEVRDTDFTLNNNTDEPLLYNDYYNYNLPNSYPAYYGSLADSFWTMDYIHNGPAPTYEWSTIFTNGVYDSVTSTWLNHGETVLKYSDLNNVTDSTRRTIIFNTSPLNANSIPKADYPGGVLNFSFNYYIGKFRTSGSFVFTPTLKVYAEIDGWTGPTVSLTGLTETGSSVSNLVELYSTTITESKDRITTPDSFSYTMPAGNKIIRYYIVVDVQQTAGAQLNLEFYLSKFLVTGPFLNSSALTVGLTNVGIAAPTIIGWTTLRDKQNDNIYLFTTNGIFNPDDPTTGPFTSYGQIWKLSYDKAGDYADPANYNMTLIYNNQLDFTIYRPIANPGMIESRYENEFIQKIYWTDNYNVPRAINVADPNVASLTVEELNLQPSLNMDMPLITEVIDGGSLTMGVYQVAYRLKNTNGSETRFSRTSQLIPIIDALEQNANVKTYYPAKPILASSTPTTYTNALKSIRVNVNNVDTDYDTIEFALIYYFDDITLPSVDIVHEAFIPENGVVNIVINGNENKVPITIDELTAFTTNIKTAKTLAAKKQTLFLGNITTGSQIVEWDARAYRFSAVTNQTTIKDTLGNIYYVDYSSVNNTYTITTWEDAAGNTYTYPVPINVPVDADCIQDYDIQAPLTTANYLYRPGSYILGGQGPNVTYEFVTETILLDNKYDIGGSTGVYSPHLTTDLNYTIVLPQDPYYKSEGVSMSNNASPYVYDMFVGYRRDEMERFGIVFFDELDNPTYVNWIADIRMPHIYMPDASYGTSAGNSLSEAYDTTSATHRSRIGVGSSYFSSDIVQYDTTNHKLYGKPLGIKFTIDFSGVPSKYKKASIVRVPKKETDKHITGQGMMFPTYKYDGISTNTQDTLAVFTTSPTGANTNPSTQETWFDTWTFHSPEFLFGNYSGFAGNDAIDFVSLLRNTVNAQVLGENAGTQGYFPLNNYNLNGTDYNADRVKYYEQGETSTRPSFIKQLNTNNPYPLVKATILSRGGADRQYNTGVTTYDTNGGGGLSVRTVHNCAPKELSGSSGGGTNGGFSYGNDSLFVQLEWSKGYNWQLATYTGDDYLADDAWPTTITLLPPITRDEGFYLANYKKILAPGVQFGGNSYFARAYSEYIPCNNLIDISNKTSPITTKVFGGDTIITVMDHIFEFFDNAEAFTFGGNNVDVYLLMQYFPVETSIAVDYRRNLITGDPKNAVQSTNPFTCVPNRCVYIGIPGSSGDAGWNTARIGTTEHFEVDNIFNHNDKSVYRYFPAPPLNKVSGLYDCRIWKSEPKIDGEIVESWSIFKPSSYKDVESAYGPINNLIIFQDKLYYFQDRGFGVAQVDEQKLLQTPNSTADLVLGSSGILERYDYISTKTGTKHQFSMSVSDYSIIWFDTLARKLYRYNPSGLNPLSDVKGMNAYLYANTAGALQVSDNPYIYSGIHSTYDFRHNEFYMTFVTGPDNTGFTLVYNDLLDGFVGEYTHMPKVYINDKTNIFSPDPLVFPQTDVLFVHNYGPYGRFYGTRAAYPSSLSFIINTSPITEKVFNNLEIVAEAFKYNNQGLLYEPLATIDYQDYFYRMRVFDNYQNTDWFDLIPNKADYSSRDNYARRHKTIWNTRIPSDRVIDNTNNIFDALNLYTDRPRLTKRLKDKWFMVELEYSNAPNNKFVVHTAKPIFSVNSR